MLTGVVLQAMRTVEIDLTAFTIVGGALAIGVGFGSQALINNFIGGLIMLAERPVRLGERITFGGTDGVVEDVGFRCTKLRTTRRSSSSASLIRWSSFTSAMLSAIVV
jgi:small-conductance mechanosensitive channel